MNAHEQFCPNPACPARGRYAAGNLKIHCRQRRRYKCTRCGRTFSERHGTMFAGLHSDPRLVRWVVILLAYGCPIQAIVRAFGLDERTVAAWRDRAGAHCQQVHQALVVQGTLDLEHVQVDEIRVKACRAVAWLASALMVRTRLWLGGVVGLQRESRLARELLRQVRACAGSATALLVCVDGWCAYPQAIRQAFREKLPRAGRTGRCRLQVWPGLAIARVVKQVRGQWVLKRELVCGTPEQVGRQLFVSQGGVHINTAFIERLNATFRERLAVLTRRCRHAAHRREALQAGMYLIGTVYNFCTAHHALRLPNFDDPARPRWHERTPAMASGLADRVWTVAELLRFKIPPPLYVPPKRRGPPPKARLPEPVRSLPRRCPCPPPGPGLAGRPELKVLRLPTLTTT